MAVPLVSAWRDSRQLRTQLEKPSGTTEDKRIAPAILPLKLRSKLPPDMALAPRMKIVDSFPVGPSTSVMSGRAMEGENSNEW